MKKALIIITICVAIASLLGATVVMAAPSGKETPANDNPKNLYLYPKDTGDDWAFDFSGAWGKLNFKLSGTDASTTLKGVFNGHGLPIETAYTLIYYPEPKTVWPHQVVVLGTGTSDDSGDVHIKASGLVGVPDDDPEIEGTVNGDKIWLVPSSHINASDEIAGWVPSMYLFEHNLINTH